MGPTPGAVLRNNAEQDIQATALFYMDYDEMPNLEQRLEQLERVFKAAKLYLHSGLAESEHARLERAIEAAR